MPSMDQLIANLADALHSTGPKTEKGKHRTRLNAYRHGLTGQIRLLSIKPSRAALPRGGHRYSDSGRFVGQPILAAAGFQPALSNRDRSVSAARDVPVCRSCERAWLLMQTRVRQTMAPKPRHSRF
jgi:hypothetical protein